MNKLFKIINNMSKGKKIYLILWIFSGVFLISLIGMFVGLSDTIGEKDQKPYTVSVEALRLKSGAEKNFSMKATKDSINKDGKISIIGGSNISFKKDDFVPVTEVAKIYNYKTYFEKDKKDEKDAKEEKTYAYKENGKIVRTSDLLFSFEDKSEITSKAKSAQNAIAAIGFIFLISLVGSVLTTTIVSKKEKGGKQ